MIKNFGGTQNDRGYAINLLLMVILLLDHEFIWFWGTDVWVLKLDFEGQEQWSRTMVEVEMMLVGT